jgi:hypothetical protein
MIRLLVENDTVPHKDSRYEREQARRNGNAALAQVQEGGGGMNLLVSKGKFGMGLMKKVAIRGLRGHYAFHYGES